MLSLRSTRPRAAYALALVGLGVIAGCGGGGSEKAEPLRLEVTQSGDSTSYRGVPREIRGGLKRIELKNASKGPATAQFIRLDGNHTGNEALEVIRATEQGRPIPAWLHAAGGVSVTPPGKTTTVTQTLPPGRYFVFNDEGEDPTKGAQANLEVKGGASGAEVPQAPATITASEYSFKFSGLKSGPNKVKFENAGSEPHHVIMAPMKKGKTLDDVRKFAKDEKGEPPIEEKEFVGTSVLDGKTSQVVDLNLKPGRYAALCFITDRKGGPPHVMMGMISEVQVQ